MPLLTKSVTAGNENKRSAPEKGETKQTGKMIGIPTNVNETKLMV